MSDLTQGCCRYGILLYLLKNLVWARIKGGPWVWLNMAAPYPAMPFLQGLWRPSRWNRKTQNIRAAFRQQMGTLVTNENSRVALRQWGGHRHQLLQMVARSVLPLVRTHTATGGGRRFRKYHSDSLMALTAAILPSTVQNLDTWAILLQRRAAVRRFVCHLARMGMVHFASVQWDSLDEDLEGGFCHCLLVSLPSQWDLGVSFVQHMLMNVKR